MLKNINKKIILSTFVATLLFTSNAIAGEKGMAILEQKCSSCHDIKGPSPTSVEEATKRQGPDLFYGGIKYKEDWLVSWLQKPVRIRPAGFMYFNHIKAGEKEDLVDENTLKPHIKVSIKEAEMIAETLMSFKAKEELVEKNALNDDPPSSFMGEMHFDKFSGCLACHQIEPEYGGYSGPEVYTIGNRLQADYIYSFIKKPEAFDKRTIMPNKELSEKALQIITKYIISLREEGGE